MSAPSWFTYIGAVTGILGSITGIAGFILGFISFRRSQAIKALDLRLELRKAESDVRADVSRLRDLLERSKQSRTAVSAARGVALGGNVQSWMAAWEIDVKAVGDLLNQLPAPNNEYRKATHRELETKLVEVHALASRGARLREKYIAELAADDRERDHIREDVRTRTQATLGKNH